MKKWISVLLLLCACVPFLFCSCNQPKEEPLSQEEVQALRGKYAYMKNPELLSIRPIYDLRELYDREDMVNGFSAVTVTGDWIRIKGNVSMGTGLGSQGITAMILPVHIDEMIFGNTKYNGSADTYLWFGSDAVVPEPNLFAKGDRFVLSTNFPTEPQAFAEHGIDEYLSTGVMGYYLTDDNVLISLKEDPGFEKYSGWRLTAFAKELNALIG